jgi:hypothetical protein
LRRNTFVSGFIAEVAPALCAQPPCGLTFADDAADWIAELPRYPSTSPIGRPTRARSAGVLGRGFGFGPVSHPDLACSAWGYAAAGIVMITRRRSSH